MALPWAVIASVGMQALDRQRKEAEARKQAVAGQHRGLAASMGAPGYEFQAAQQKQAIDDTEGTNYLQALLPLFNKGGGGK